MGNFILITSSGYGTGKTTLADRLPGFRLGLGIALRHVAAGECLSNLDSSLVLNSFSQDFKEREVYTTNGPIQIRQLLIETAKNLGDEQLVSKWYSFLMDQMDMVDSVIVDDIRSYQQLQLVKTYLENIQADSVHLHLEARGVSVQPDLNYEEEPAKLKSVCDYLIIRDDRPISVSGTGDFSQNQLRWMGAL